MLPYFSVVIPSYNRADTILETLNSVKKQSFADFECVIVDDGSSDVDDLEAIVRDLDDSRFRVIRRINGGGGAARNTGVKAAKGQYIAFLDSDDLYLPNKLEKYRSEIDRSPSPSSTVYFSQVIVDRGEFKTWRKPSRAPLPNERIDDYLVLKGGFIQTSTIVCERNMALRVPFDELLSFGQDTDFSIRLWAAGYTFAMLPQPLAVWKDDSVAKRVSSSRRFENMLDWTQRNSDILSKRSFLAYRGWHGAKAAVSQRPVLSARLFLTALLNGAFPPLLALRVATQIALPPALYRAVANLTVRFSGNVERDAQ